MKALALRNVCRGVGGAIYQAIVPQELFPVLLAVARGNALTPRIPGSPLLVLSSHDRIPHTPHYTFIASIFYGFESISH
jgi:hypothetical protein